jgi:MarR family transcriptional regulator, transcriptional regulator for hemolysin
MRPVRTPVGLQLTQASRAISRAFDEALAEAGGTLPGWLVLLSIKGRSVANQRELAQAMGITSATLTHHLNGMERSGLLTRRRDPANRRVHVVELTAAGETAFTRLRATALEFDQRLRRGLTEEQIDALGGLLDQLVANVAGGRPGLPWAGLAERESLIRKERQRWQSPAATGRPPAGCKPAGSAC